MSDAETPKSEQQQTEQPEAAQSEQETFVPPATLDYLIFSLRTQAELQLGLLHFGEEKDRPKPNLPLARHSIDLLGVLQEKTRGNLTLEEQRYLENSLTELRFRYVQAAQEKQPK
ncbi:MAG: DUF1844 domain-containing protein [Rhodospirillales bacterium]